MKQKRILWIDDEIELLRSHIILLSEKGYDTSTVTNGSDAIEMVKTQRYDLIFLDEMMPGMGGLETLAKMKDIDANVPVVMVTKSEEETLMNEAIGSKISDYLTKPVNPSQILLVCKKFLEGKQLAGQYVAKDYMQDFNTISMSLHDDLDDDDWRDIYLKLVNWDIELDAHPDIGLRQTLNGQRKECNKEFSKFVEKKYAKWLKLPLQERPTLTVDVVSEYLVPQLQQHQGPVFFFVLDCLRLDQWMMMEKLLSEYFNINRNYYYSILPTATAYSRNALFAGLFPSEIEKYFPDIYTGNDDNERSMNKYEKEMLQAQLERRRVRLRNESKYIKIIDPEYGRNFEQNILSYQNTHLTSVVVNFLDMIAHGRSDSDLLKEIAPDEAAYRSLTASWFNHSSLLNTLKTISRIKDASIVITTDHGSIRALRGAKVLGEKETSTNLRFKFGRNLKVDDKHALFIKDPVEYKLPKRAMTTNYIIAKEDYYFVYPTEYHKYLSHYKDTFQHGGISLEEMILPVITLGTR